MMKAQPCLHKYMSSKGGSLWLCSNPLFLLVRNKKLFLAKLVHIWQILWVPTSVHNRTAILLLIQCPAAGMNWFICTLTVFLFQSPCRWPCQCGDCTLWWPCSWPVSSGASSCWVQSCPSCCCLPPGTAGSQIALWLLGSPCLWCEHQLTLLLKLLMCARWS